MEAGQQLSQLQGNLTDRRTLAQKNTSNIKSAAFSILGPSTQQLYNEKNKQSVPNKSNDNSFMNFGQVASNQSTIIDDYSNFSLDFSGSPYSSGGVQGQIGKQQNLNQSFKLPNHSMLLPANSTNEYGVSDDLSLTYKNPYQGAQGIQKVLPQNGDQQQQYSIGASNFNNQQQPYRDFSVDKLNMRAQVSSSGALQDQNKTSSFNAYKEGAHQIKNHGAALLKNHIGVSSNLIMLNHAQNGAAKASINGGIAIPNSIQHISAKRVFLDNNAMSSPGLNSQTKKSSFLDDIKPISLDRLNVNQQINQNQNPYSNQAQVQPGSTFSSPLKNQTMFSGNNDVNNNQQRNQGTLISQDRLQSKVNRELDDFLRDDYTMNNNKRQ
eukprot:403364275